MNDPCPASPTFGYPCDPVCERCGQGQPDPLELPAPDGVDVHGVVAHWRLASGEWLFAQPGHVFEGRGPSLSLDEVEQDALAALAAVDWARRLGA